MDFFSSRVDVFGIQVTQLPRFHLFVERAEFFLDNEKISGGNYSVEKISFQKPVLTLGPPPLGWGKSLSWPGPFQGEVAPFSLLEIKEGRLLIEAALGSSPLRLEKIVGNLFKKGNALTAQLQSLSTVTPGELDLSLNLEQKKESVTARLRFLQGSGLSFLNSLLSVGLPLSVSATSGDLEVNIGPTFGEHQVRVTDLTLLVASDSRPIQVLSGEIFQKGDHKHFQANLLEFPGFKGQLHLVLSPGGEGTYILQGMIPRDEFCPASFKPGSEKKYFPPEMRLFGPAEFLQEGVRAGGQWSRKTIFRGRNSILMSLF
jgi:hypothetical protein